jgi:succinate dehydrogenase / fumarate reductase cytochrome b subunit
MQKALSLFDTTLGKKAVMAVTGLVLLGFLLGHMLGNLQVYLGPEVLDAYAVKLRALGPLLWAIRSILLLSFILHSWMVIDLYARSTAARPIGYRKRQNLVTSYAAQAMWLSGIVILLFVVFHIAHFTFPGIAMSNTYVHDEHGKVFQNVVNAFQIPWVSGLYLLAQVILGTHIYHGSWSLLQTLGISHPRYDGPLRGVAKSIAVIIVVGNCSIPLAVLAGLVK